MEILGYFRTKCMPKLLSKFILQESCPKEINSVNFLEIMSSFTHFCFLSQCFSFLLCLSFPAYLETDVFISNIDEKGIILVRGRHYP